MIVPLYDFDEDCRPVLQWLGEYLEEVAVVVVVHQDLELLEDIQVLLHLVMIQILLQSQVSQCHTVVTEKRRCIGYICIGFNNTFVSAVINFFLSHTDSL